MLTPCKQVCRIDDGICKDCGRTLEQIATWSAMEKGEREEIMENL